MVGKICSICRRCSYIERNISFFAYPGNSYRRLEWLTAVNRLDLVEKLNNDRTRGNTRICELHFERRFVSKSKTSDGRKYLSKDAVPTLLLESSKNSANKLRLTRSRLSQRQVYRNGRDNQDWMNVHNLDVKSENGSYMEFSSPHDSNEDSDEAPDVLQYCESVIKVTKSTQTHKLATDSNGINNDVVGAGTDVTPFLKMCSNFLSPSLYKIIEWTFSVKGGENVNLQLLALSLYYSSDVYNLLENMLGLPTLESFKYFLIPKSTRLSSDLINAFRCKVNSMSAREKLCSLSVGCILLKPSLYYDIKHDRIIGFHDVNGTQTTSVAKYAILLMVQGILVNWRQPVTYAFIAGYDNYPEISDWIDEVMTILLDIGLDVRTFVSDPRSEFLYRSESRFVSPERTSFTINGSDVYYTYDAVQLLNIVKNNLKSCDFHYDSCNNSNNVEFVEKVKNLCHLLNAKTQYSNSPFKGAFANKKCQREFLNNMLQLFQKLRVIRKADNVDVTENMKFVEDFQITIKSVLQLYNDLNVLGVKYLLTSRLNHNCLKRIMNKLKQYNPKDECTPRQFHKSFVRSFVFSMLKKPAGSKRAGDSIDCEEFCQQLLDEEFQETEDSDLNQPLIIFTTDYRQELPEKNAFVYICGYCYLKCIQHHNCDAFKSYINESKKKSGKDNSSYVCSVSLDFNIGNCEMMPPDSFTEFLMRLECKFKEFLNADVSFSNIGHEIRREFDTYEFEAPCPCFPVDYLKDLFIRVRLFYTIRKNNKLYSKKKGAKLFRVFSL